MSADDADPVRLAFVCVQNAGRSQMSAAFAEQEIAERGLDVEIVSGGTDPAEAIHPEVVASMREVGIDLSDRRPQEISAGELDAARVVATMGCSTLDVDPDTDVRDWDLPDPDGKPPERVREIRETVRERVAALFDELEASGAAEPDAPEGTDSR